MDKLLSHANKCYELVGMYVCIDMYHMKNDPNANDIISASQLASHIFSGIWATPSCCQVSSTTVTQSPAEVHPIPHVLPLIMESHNAALYGPYQPCPIVARDFTANDVTQLKTKLAELVTYVHIHISLCLFHFNDLFVFSYVLCLSARVSLPGRHRSVRLSSCTNQIRHHAQRCRSPSANHQ